MEKIWSYILYDDLKISPEEHKIFLTEPPLNPLKNREKMAQVMFEKFQVPGTYFSVQVL